MLQAVALQVSLVSVYRLTSGGARVFMVLPVLIPTSAMRESIATRLLFLSPS